ncbi:HD domain-containing protein [bacterium]|nr:HD domain-containing protein [bacterium]
MAREKLYRDSVHDLILLNLDDPSDHLLGRLIDSREFQRLRRIKQLGMAHMAFHGAEHSRFCHSFGVMHLTRRLINRLRQDNPIEDSEALAVMCAGLLHDLGHGPFSHVIEKYFPEGHETWTQRIILHPDTEVNAILESYSPGFSAHVAAVLRGEAEPRWLNWLISSQLDVDRFDYLLRDSHMTGVKYGVFDLERLMLMLRVSPDGDRIVVSPKGVLPVEKYLQSRYQMYRQVYFHKTVTAAEAMLMGVLGRASELARENGACPEVAADSPFGRILRGEQDLEVADYLQLDDSVILGALNHWSRTDDPILRDLSFRLLNRRLFKSLEIANFEEHDLEIKMRIAEAEKIISDAGLDPRYNLLYSMSADTPYRPYNPRTDKTGAVIWVEDPVTGQLRDVKDVSPTIRAFTESPYTIWRVFFPEAASDIRVRERITEAFVG